jgi:uracil-DNA glycosylase
MTNYDSIEALHRDLRQCRLCLEAGYDIQSLPVFSGYQSARLMLIGQAPGSIEATEGFRQPFMGDAGRRLFRWLERAGWDEQTFRETAYITAVTKCFPGTNPAGSGDRVPRAAERRLCRPWLDAELALVQPEVIVPVGRLAVDLFYPEKPRLSEVIGTSQQDDEGRLLLPLPHPSGASRWLNQPRNVGRLEQALYLLRTVKAERGL